jgi:uncharacterized phage protein (TIGR01671 family)
MEELKFKAWHKQKKCMFQVTAMNFRRSGKLYSVSPNQGDDFYLVGDEVEVIQYTGQKDIGNIEIYEGDVVRFKRNRFTHKDFKIKRGKVIFENSSFMIFTDSKKYNKKIDLTAYNIKYFEIEVIGNIYENKELVKGL